MFVRFRGSRLNHFFRSFEYWGVARSSSLKATLFKFESLSAMGVVVSDEIAGSDSADTT